MVALGVVASQGLVRRNRNNVPPSALLLQSPVMAGANVPEGARILAVTAMGGNNVRDG